MRIPIYFLLGALTLMAQGSQWAGKFSGLIINKRGRRPLPSVEIHITGMNSNYSKTRVSSASGIFTIEQVPAGMYKVTFQKEGFTPVAMVVELIDGKDTSSVVYLGPLVQ